MNSAFGEIFLFLTNLAWKSRVTIPVLVTTIFLIMDIRLQIEINIQSGQVAAAELEQLDDTDDDDDGNPLGEEYASEEETNDEDDNDILFCEIEQGAVVEDDEDDDDDDDEYENTANRLRRSLGLS